MFNKSQLDMSVYLVSFRLLFTAGFVGLALTRCRWVIGSLSVPIPIPILSDL